MSLFLLETSFSEEFATKAEVKSKVARLKEQLNEIQALLIEVQISKDYSQGFFIIETTDEEAASAIVSGSDFIIKLVKEVRLIGEDLEDVKKQEDGVNFLVEWNLPENLTMDQYLNRKTKNSVHYAEVPEVAFARTYVCEDMTKCLCFYDAPDVAAVKRAREAVSAPIDAITELGENIDE